jgi:hypothetical protein
MRFELRPAVCPSATPTNRSTPRCQTLTISPSQLGRVHTPAGQELQFDCFSAPGNTDSGMEHSLILVDLAWCVCACTPRVYCSELLHVVCTYRRHFVSVCDSMHARAPIRVLCARDYWPAIMFSNCMCIQHTPYACPTSVFLALFSFFWKICLFNVLNSCSTL